MKKWLIYIIAIGLLASLVQMGYRYQSEQQNKQLEIAFDYRDLIYVASLKTDQREYLQNQLLQLKQEGVTTIGISESSLDELEQLQRIDAFSAKELSFLTRDSSFDPGYTYLVFKDELARQSVENQIRVSFSRINVNVEKWRFEGKDGLKISLPQSFAQKITLLPDEFSMKEIQKMGFQMILRVSNRVDYNADYNRQLLQLAVAHDVRRVFFDGESVPGYEEEDKELTKQNLQQVGSLMKELKLGMAIIELLKYEPKGLRTVAKEIGNDVVRIHSITERDATMESDVISARIALAVKDRNIRIVFLNVSLLFAHDRNKIVDTLADGNLIEALNGEQGALKTLEKAGFKLGTAQPYQLSEPPLPWLFQFLSVIGSLALIYLMAIHFAPGYSRLLLIGAVFVTLGLFFLSPSALYKVLALGAAISAPVLAVIYAVKRLREATPSIFRAILMFITACATSMVGALYVSGLLHGVTFMVVLDQFSGVSVLHLLPMLLIALYVIFYHQKNGVHERFDHARQLMIKPVNVLWLTLAGIGGVFVLYYLSRTGNSGQTIELEIMFRHFLEDTLGVRPRTKEFLFAHPLFILAGYLAFRYRQVTLLFILGVMGQLSIVSSFTHLHTPLIVSLLRVIYGMAGGILVGLLLILIWNVASKGWQRWLLTLKKS
jgi:hypothetical protein